MTREEYLNMSRAERVIARAKIPAQRYQCWLLHSQGKSFRQIATIIGLPKPSDAYRYFKLYHKELNKATQEEMKDTLLDELHRIRDTNDDDKVKMQAMDRIMKLYNLDQQKVTLSADESFCKIIEGIPKDSI